MNNAAMPDKSIGERVVLQLYGQWRLVPGPEEARIEAKYSQERLALAIDAAIAADRQERCAGVHAELAAAEKRVAELVGLLKELEWSVYVRGMGDTCPVCYAEHGEGHAPDCRLAAAIKGGA